MFKRTAFVSLLAFGLTALLTSRAVSQDESADQKEAQAGDGMSAEAMAQMMEYIKLTQPGEPHKFLKQYIGEWDVEIKMMDPATGQQTMVSTGTSTVKSVLGGRYILEEHKSTMMGMPYEGIGLYGYDNYKNLFTAVWISNMSTEMLTMKGAKHPESQVITMYGQMDEPALNVHGRTVKYVWRPVVDGKYVFDVTDVHVSEDYKVIEMIYTRKGANKDD